MSHRRFSACKRGSPYSRATRALLLLVAVGVAAWCGCTRSYYRRQADKEAYQLVHEKANFPRWPLDGYTIEMDPRSRMFDPYSPDREPMPLDDPIAHQLMHNIDGRRAWPWWHKNGETQQIENPAWLTYLPVDEKGFVQLDAKTAVDLALLHSPDYQQQLETMYLSAIDVSFERFRLDTQFFAGHATTATTDGPRRLGGGGSSSSTLALATNPTSNGFNAQRLGATGSQMLVGLANSMVWQYSGSNSLTARTLLDFSLIQPLLRNAGRDRVLERLTIVERNLLYNVRQMERYRRGFYLNVVTGRGPGQGTSRRGGVFGGAGLSGFSGVGSGGFGQIATTGGGGFGGGGGTTGAGAAGAGGFMGLLQTQQQIRNLEFNIEGLRTNLYRLTNQRDAAHTFILTTETPALRAERILREELQVAQAQQALNNAEGQLINNRNGYEQSLDQFKANTLGLPPQICIEISDPMLDPFKLISDETRVRQTTINNLMQQIGATNNAILAEAKSEVVQLPTGASVKQTLKWTDELERQIQQLRDYLGPLDEIAKAIDEQNLPPAIADLEKFEQVLPRRQAALDRLWRNYECKQKQLAPLLPLGELDRSVFETGRLTTVRDQLRQELVRLRAALGGYPARIEELRTEIERILDASKKRELGGGAPDSQDLYNELVKLVDPDTREVKLGVTLRMQAILADFSDDVFSLQLLQARARSESVELVPVELSSDTAFEIARHNRRDWMNARSALVDSWRLIQFNANDLETGLNLIFNGDVANVGDNPLDLRTTTGRIQMGLQIDAPLTRLAERNTYRQALIEFQQQRRSFYQFRDSVSFALRNELRTLEANALNFELRRSAVRTAAQQIVINDAILESRAGQASGPTAARDAVSALSDLQSAQNDFLSVWVNYELLRRSLDFDLGTMELDKFGKWIDPGQIGDEDPCQTGNCNPPWFGGDLEDIYPEPPAEEERPQSESEGEDLDPPIRPLPMPTQAPLLQSPPPQSPQSQPDLESLRPQPVPEMPDDAHNNDILDDRLRLEPLRLRLSPPETGVEPLAPANQLRATPSSAPQRLPEPTGRPSTSIPLRSLPRVIDGPQLVAPGEAAKASRFEEVSPAEPGPANPLRGRQTGPQPLRPAS